MVKPLLLPGCDAEQASEVTSPARGRASPTVAGFNYFRVTNVCFVNAPDVFLLFILIFCLFYFFVFVDLVVLAKL